MTRNILRKMTRVFASDIDSEQVHFHAGPSGRAAVCDNPRCNAPALDPADIAT
jgi:hypothetical protein